METLFKDKSPSGISDKRNAVKIEPGIFLRFDFSKIFDVEISFVMSFQRTSLNFG